MISAASGWSSMALPYSRPQTKVLIVRCVRCKRVCEMERGAEVTHHEGCVQISIRVQTEIPPDSGIQRRLVTQCDCELACKVNESSWDHHGCGQKELWRLDVRMFVQMSIKLSISDPETRLVRSQHSNPRTLFHFTWKVLDYKERREEPRFESLHIQRFERELWKPSLFLRTMTGLDNVRYLCPSLTILCVVLHGMSLCVSHSTDPRSLESHVMHLAIYLFHSRWCLPVYKE